MRAVPICVRASPPARARPRAAPVCQMSRPRPSSHAPVLVPAHASHMARGQPVLVHMRLRRRRVADSRTGTASLGLEEFTVAGISCMTGCFCQRRNAAASIAVFVLTHGIQTSRARCSAKCVSAPCPIWSRFAVTSWVRPPTVEFPKQAQTLHRATLALIRFQVCIWPPLFAAVDPECQTIQSSCRLWSPERVHSAADPHSSRLSSPEWRPRLRVPFHRLVGPLA